MRDQRYFLDNRELQDISDKSENIIVKNLIKIHQTTSPNTLFKLTNIKDKLYIDLAGETIQVGLAFEGRYIEQNDKIIPKLASLNCGGFGVNEDQAKDQTRYDNLKLKLLGYIKNKCLKVFHFQDFPCDSKFFSDLSDLGYSGIWIPNIIFSEGNYPQNPNTGLLSIFQNTSNFHNIQNNFCFHESNFARLNNYNKKRKDEDLLIANCSLYQSFEDAQDQTISLLTNTYISPFSTQPRRQQNIVLTVENIIKIKQELQSKFVKYKILERFTGDFNLYGINSLYGIFGLSVKPWSFGLPLLASLMTGINIPNKLEITKLSKALSKLGYRISPTTKNENQTIFIRLADHLPKFLKPAFRKIKVGWQLDMCISPNEYNYKVSVDPEPFGDFDHSCLVVSL